jgi:hypothetical protein
MPGLFCIWGWVTHGWGFCLVGSGFVDAVKGLNLWVQGM